MPIKVLELHHHGIRIDPADDAQQSARDFYSGAARARGGRRPPEHSRHPRLLDVRGRGASSAPRSTSWGQPESLRLRAARKKTRPGPTWPSPSRTSRRHGASWSPAGSGIGPSRASSARTRIRYSFPIRSTTSSSSTKSAPAGATGSPSRADPYVSPGRRRSVVSDFAGVTDRGRLDEMPESFHAAVRAGS